GGIEDLLRPARGLVAQLEHRPALRPFEVQVPASRLDTAQVLEHDLEADVTPEDEVRLFQPGLPLRGAAVHARPARPLLAHSRRHDIPPAAAEGTADLRAQPSDSGLRAVCGQMSRKAHCPHAMYDGRASNWRCRTRAETSRIASSVRAASSSVGRFPPT